MVGSRHNTPSTCPLSSFEARVQWAIKNRQVYVYDGGAELNVNVPRVADEDDNDDIEDLQRKYERRYRIKKEERARQEEENKEIEKERMLRELLRRFPEVRLQTTVGESSNAGPPQSKRKRDVDTPVRPMKVVKLASEKPTFGDKYDVPCDRCNQKGISCHEQCPAKVSCFECRKAKSGCSFVSTAKGIPRGANQKKSPLSASSSEEDDYPSPAGFRRSVRNLGSTYSSADLSSLITVLESINTTIRDGFEKLQKTLERLDGDNNNHMDNQGFTNHIKRPGSSPAY